MANGRLISNTRVERGELTVAERRWNALPQSQKAFRKQVTVLNGKGEVLYSVPKRHKTIEAFLKSKSA